MGNEVAAPDTRKSPITAAYVTRQRTHTSFRSTNDAYPRYRMTASASVEPTKRYPGTLSRTAGRARMPATDSNAANANQIAPNSATGTPRTVL